MPSAIHWQRLDTQGAETALLEDVAGGWLLTGVAAFIHDKKPCGFSYTVKCSDHWQTLSANISGHVGTQTHNYQISKRGNSWRINDEDCPCVQGCIDIDIGFTPSTNLIPIRRLDLANGETASIETAWFQFPNMRLVALAQTYTRLASNKYRYESPENNFTCTVETNEDGFVTQYPGFWSSEDTQ